MKHQNTFRSIIILLLVVYSIVSFHSCTKTNTKPTGSIEQPKNNSSYTIGDCIRIKTVCQDNEDNISNITLLINDLEIDLTESYSKIYLLKTSTLKAGDLCVKLLVEDSEGLWHMDSVRIMLKDIPVISQAKFSADRMVGASPLTVNFTDSSSNSPQLWRWDFGDGTTSTDQHPKYTYISDGTYSVSLAAGIEELNETLIKTNFITVYAPIAPLAGFSASPTAGTTPLEVTFSDTSKNHPTQWLWDFGDGTLSTEQNPVKTYSLPGEYYVALDVSNDISNDRKVCNDYIHVEQEDQAPLAGIQIPIVSGDVNSKITFLDGSQHMPEYWEWNFGDGNTSSAQNPVHTYNNTGNHTITLTVSNALGENSITIQNAVTIYGPCAGVPEVVDIDGNQYKTVQIGDQCWMAENLAVSRYPDGTEIPYIEKTSAWSNLENNNEEDAYCYYHNTQSFGYGALYTYGAASAKGWLHQNQEYQGICPDGWHLPNDEEWKILEGAADTHFNPGNSVFDLTSWRGFDTGKQLKSVSGWYSKRNGENRSGFTALPGGMREENGEFHTHEYGCVFWTGSEYYNGKGETRKLSYDNDGSWRTTLKRSSGLYVRCVKNEE